MEAASTTSAVEGLLGAMEEEMSLRTGKKKKDSRGQLQGETLRPDICNMPRNCRDQNKTVKMYGAIKIEFSRSCKVVPGLIEGVEGNVF